MIAKHKPATKRRPGRPSVRTHRIQNAICVRIARGESLRSICKDTAMPARSTVYRWLAADARKRRQMEIIRRAMIAEGLMPDSEST